jgi:LysM repeat protein
MKKELSSLINSSHDTVSDNLTLSYLLESVTLSRAAELARSRKLKQAEELVSTLVNRPDASIASLDLLAKIYAQQGRMEEARPLWKRALQKDPSNPHFQKALARCEKNQQFGFLTYFLGTIRVMFVWLLLIAIVTFTILSNIYVREQVQDLKKEVQQLNILYKPVSNLDLQNLIEKALSSDTFLSSLSLTIAQDNGTIHVIGQVPSLLMRYQVETKIRSIAGSEIVDLSALTLMQTYTVQRGDSLWLIVKNVYGTPDFWKLLAEANNIQPPYVIHVGDKLVLPITLFDTNH